MTVLCVVNRERRSKVTGKSYKGKVGSLIRWPAVRGLSSHSLWCSVKSWRRKETQLRSKGRCCCMCLGEWGCRPGRWIPTFHLCMLLQAGNPGLWTLPIIARCSSTSVMAGDKSSHSEEEKMPLPVVSPFLAFACLPYVDGNCLETGIFIFLVLCSVQSAVQLWAQDAEATNSR